MSEKCSAMVYYSGAWRRMQCSNRGKVQRDGKWYCGIHDPAKREAKERAEAEARASEDARRDDALARAKSLGVGSPDYRAFGKYRYTGGLSLAPDECDRLIERLSREKKT